MEGKDILKVLTRVNRGIEWLDKKHTRKGWLKKIRLNRLVLADSGTCVIGEVEGDFGSFKGNAVSKGFDRSYEDYDVLTAVWTVKLKELGAK